MQSEWWELKECFATYPVTLAGGPSPNDDSRLSLQWRR